MWAWLKKLFGQHRPDESIEACARAVLVFMRSVKANVDQRDFMIPNHHTLFYCYAFGAVIEEARQYAMNDTEQHAVLLLLFPNLSDLSSEEISGLLNRCLNTLQEEEGQSYMRDGAEHYLRWQNADAGVTNLLGKRLEKREKESTRVDRAAIYR